MLKCPLEIRGTAGLSVGSLWVWPLSTWRIWSISNMYAVFSMFWNVHIWFLLMFLSTGLICSCFTVSMWVNYPVMLCRWHACITSNSQRPAPAPILSLLYSLARSVAMVSACRFCVVAMGTPYYSLPPSSHHVSALSFVCLLYTNALK